MLLATEKFDETVRKPAYNSGHELIPLTELAVLLLQAGGGTHLAPHTPRNCELIDAAARPPQLLQ